MKTSEQISVVEHISAERFQNEFVKKGQPVVIKGAVENWAALSKWSNEFFRDEYGEIKIGRVPINDGKWDLENLTPEHLSAKPLKEVIQPIMEGQLDNCYVIGTPIDGLGKELRSDCPDLTYCKGGKFLRSNLLISPKGAITPLHQDMQENLYVMVKGSKKWTLFHPSAPVYPHSRFSKLPNHAQLDPLNIDLEKFPEFRDAQPFTATIATGDVLYVPSFWWHHLQTPESSIAVNFWYSIGWKSIFGLVSKIFQMLRKW